MNRREAGVRGGAGSLVGLLAAVLLGLCGCTGPQVRSQSEEEPDPGPRYPDVKTVGDITDFGNADPMPVGGVGLVEGLDGTGGDAPGGGYRGALEELLKKRSERE